MCKYHIVFTPKYRRKVIYNQLRNDIREIIIRLCQYKGVEIIEGHLMSDHVHMLVMIPPKLSVSSFMGYLKGKSALMIFDRHANLKYKYGNRHFWSEGYYVSTVGLNDQTVAKYIIDECEKNYPILKQVKTLFKQLYSYALCYNYISDNRSKYIDLRMYKMNYKPREIKRFTGEQINLIWNNYTNKFDEIILMLIYTGVRICELLNLHKKDVNLKERYFKVEDSKTSSGIRVVPIANKILLFFEEWYSSSNDANSIWKVYF